jgi:hypothetical protein
VSADEPDLMHWHCAVCGAFGVSVPTPDDADLVLPEGWTLIGYGDPRCAECTKAAQ